MLGSRPAIQIANRLGAMPVALTRTSVKADELRAHGAAAVVATEEQDVVTEVRNITEGKGAELVFDPVGGPMFAKLLEATASGGLLRAAVARQNSITPLTTWNSIKVTGTGWTSSERYHFRAWMCTTAPAKETRNR